jgi:anti-sigma factor RsiW
MKCEDARERMLEARRGADVPELAAHLETCEACRLENEADAALDVALGKLPRADTPASLRRDIETRIRPRRRSRASMLVAIALIAVIVAIVAWRRPAAASDPMITEAVNDHLRVLYADKPVEIASGGIHQVKPWFAGRLDFAPVMPFAGDDDFPLEGGSVAYFLDRKAAAFVFKRRLHTITVFVFRAEGLPWRGLSSEASSRGFNTILFRSGDLGYALVSDVDQNDLHMLATRIGYAARPR